MNKSQAIHKFWNSFEWPAYDENTVPKDAPIPRITYNVTTDSFENVVNLYGSLWDRNASWERIVLKSMEIEKYLGEHGGEVIDLDIGKLWLVKGTPFAQRMGDPDDSAIRRIYINVQAEFLTPY